MVEDAIEEIIDVHDRDGGMPVGARVKLSSSECKTSVKTAAVSEC